jgi:hypothetical protein
MFRSRPEKPPVLCLIEKPQFAHVKVVKFKIQFGVMLSFGCCSKAAKYSVRLSLLGAVGAAIGPS